METGIAPRSSATLKSLPIELLQIIFTWSGKWSLFLTCPELQRIFPTEARDMHRAIKSLRPAPARCQSAARALRKEVLWSPWCDLALLHHVQRYLLSEKVYSFMREKNITMSKGRERELRRFLDGLPDGLARNLEWSLIIDGCKSLLQITPLELRIRREVLCVMDFDYIVPNCLMHWSPSRAQTIFLGFIAGSCAQYQRDTRRFSTRHSARWLGAVTIGLKDETMYFTKRRHYADLKRCKEEVLKANEIANREMNRFFANRNSVAVQRELKRLGQARLFQWIDH